MSYPNKSVLAGAGPDDAWFIVRGRNGTMLVSTSGASVIAGVQRALLTIIDVSEGHYGSPAEWRLQFGSWDGGNWQTESGQWNAATARAAITIADTWLTDQAKSLRYAWREYYAHRWGLSLIQLALNLWVAADASGLRSQIRIAEESDSPSAENIQVIVPNETILPRWNYRPQGSPSPITVRFLGDYNLTADDAEWNSMSPEDRAVWLHDRSTIGHWNAMTPSERGIFMARGGQNLGE